jgi:hypothetical protein
MRTHGISHRRLVSAGRRCDERGVVTAFVAIMAVGLVTAAGLVYDGGQILNRYRQAGDLAAQAARAAAQGVDRTSLQAGEPLVDISEASQRADSFLADAGYPGAGTVTVDGDEVTVTVTLSRQAYVVPFGPREVTASASAALAQGVDEARPGGP